MLSSRSILNAFFVLAIALALVPVAQASIYAMADGVNFNALARQKAQKRTQQNYYKEIVRNPFRLFKRQEPDPGTPIPTPTDIGTISNTSMTTSAETTTSDISSSITTLEPTSTDDGLSTTSTEAEITSSETEITTTDGITTTPSSSTDLPSSTDVTTTSEAQTTTEDVTSTAEETSTTTSDGPLETSTEVTTTTEVESSTTTIRTTLDTTVKSAFTTAWSTSTFTLPNGAVGTVTEFLVVVPTLGPTRAQNPQETETATGTASLHTNAGTFYTPGPAAPVVALMAVLGYVGGAAF
ncbi:hypothetical protein TWF106_002769 [Orbilia oligospora]|uniref:Uncharacterized protein n=1 Tax=Orbilia oligospora TaxID=2813651 RepID=A0A7C8UFG7_ORBOL|nr:hypothetical protein TWF106_002769 [Orbilia oligospora]